MSLIPSADLGTDFRQCEIELNMPSPLPAVSQTELITLKKNVRTAFSWATALVRENVHRKIDAGKLAADDIQGESIYRAKVMKAVFSDRSPWLSVSQFSNICTPMDLRLSEFKVDTLLECVREMRPVPPERARIREFIQNYSHRVVNGDMGHGASALHYWLAIAVFSFNSFTGRIDTDIYMYDVMLKTTNYQVKYTPRKTSEESIRQRSRSPAGSAPQSPPSPIPVSPEETQAIPSNMSTDDTVSGHSSKSRHSKKFIPKWLYEILNWQDDSNDSGWPESSTSKGDFSPERSGKIEGRKVSLRGEKKPRFVDMVRVEPSFSAVQYRFDNDMFESVKAAVEKSLRELGMKQIQGREGESYQ